jgi:hypothetical protein
MEIELQYREVGRLIVGVEFRFEDIETYFGSRASELPVASSGGVNGHAV